LVVHLDGVPHALLQDAIATGKMPFLSGLVQSGNYQFERAFWGSPASTPAFQAGILYGVRHANIPGYHWYDRELGRVVWMNQPKDTQAIEARLAEQAPEGLLEDGGTSYLTLFSGHAPNNLCMSGLTDLRRPLIGAFGEWRGVRACARGGATAFLRDALVGAARAGAEVLQWCRKVQDTRHEWGHWVDHLLVFQAAWSLARNRAILDMVRGVPAVYLVYGNYDSTSHRRGPSSEQAKAQLYAADASMAELYAVARSLPEPYDVYFLTDHGQVHAEPFESRHGHALADYLFRGPPAFVPAQLERALAVGGPPEAPVAPRAEAPEVVEAGNYAHVYLTLGRRPLQASEVLAQHREVLARALAHPDIALVALRQGDEAVAVLGGEVYRAQELDRAPLPALYSRQAVKDLLLELPHMPNAGDLVLYGQELEKGATVGFAWEFGSHGGLTHAETDSAVLGPRHAGVELSGLGHATELYERLSARYRV
jgi:hypothetical protein